MDQWGYVKFGKGGTRTLNNTISTTHLEQQLMIILILINPPIIFGLIIYSINCQIVVFKLLLYSNQQVKTSKLMARNDRKVLNPDI